MCYEYTMMNVSTHTLILIYRKSLIILIHDSQKKNTKFGLL